jgi:hypothetical protein
VLVDAPPQPGNTALMSTQRAETAVREPIVLGLGGQILMVAHT